MNKLKSIYRIHISFIIAQYCIRKIRTVIMNIKKTFHVHKF